MKQIKQLIYGLVFMSVSGGLLHAADLNEGFLGIQWGTPISELKNFSKISQKGDVGYYKSSQKSYSVFGVEAANVAFGFYRDKFFAAYVAVEAIETFNRVKNHLTEKFGPPKIIVNTKYQQTIFRWKHEEARIKLKLYEGEGKMKLAFYYNPLAAKVNAAQREAIPAIPSDTFSIESSSRQGQEAVKYRRLQQAMDIMQW